MSAPGSPVLPVGVVRFPLKTFPDARGRFAELFRTEWPTGFRPVQWNFFESVEGCLRGPKVHPRHADLLILLQGRMAIPLKDLRRGSPTEGLSAVLVVDGSVLEAVLVPRGVMHALQSLTPTLLVYGVTHTFDPVDEPGCRADDPALDLAWPLPPGEGPQARETRTFADLLAYLEPWQPIPVSPPSDD